MSNLVAKVAIEGLVYHIDKLYSYSVPNSLSDSVSAGIRVTVPFGKGNRKRQGLIVELEKTAEVSELKQILQIIDAEPLLDSEMLGVLKYLKNSTFCTWFDALKTLLPYGLCCRIVETYTLCSSVDISSLSGDEKLLATLVARSKNGISRKSLCEKAGIVEESNLIEVLVSKGIITRSDLAVRNTGDASTKMIKPTAVAEDLIGELTTKQKQVMSVLFDAGCCSVKELCYFSGVGISVVNNLVKRGAAEIFEQVYYRTNDSSYVAPAKSPDLTSEQTEAFNKLSSLLGEEKPSAALLYGVTGSGKTQVFMKLCEKAVNEGKGVIVMVPEIALTPQTVSKFKSLFGDRVALFHSAMSQGTRMDEWRRVKEGKAIIAVGTRSAVFAPVQNLGLIIMDEEQEHTYKSEKSPRFHARDVAKFRAKQNNATLLMASATPSIESYFAAKEGRYTLCELEARYGSATLPKVEVVDMRPYLQSGGGALSRELCDRISETLENGKQVILLLNRRGKNTIVSCSKCGHVMTCENCSIALTYHSANNKLMCHYCGTSHEYVNKCSECGSEHIRYSGFGTQKIEEELAEIFPNAKILRMDSDSTMTKDSYEKGLSAFARGEYDIMLGTQMVAKGLDFPNVTLVGVISADASMYSTDFKGAEQTFSLLTQVVGRSGRGSDKGTALVQTAFPDNEIISLAAKQDYKEFFSQEILTRKLMIYPPYCDIAQIVVSGVERDNTEKTANLVAKKIEEYVGGEFSDVKVIVLGPSVAAVPKMNGKYRYRMVVKCKNNSRTRAMFNKLLLDFAEPSKRAASVYIDINPENLI
ncbi:MAG: primosomal protein N' [Clostridia bacterium]|nr:primosomal protein N' [Clostridia bacterium]